MPPTTGSRWITRSTAFPFAEKDPGPTWDPWTSQPSQLYDWTCSACATEWTERAFGAARSDDVYANREAVVYHIGYPSDISSALGLHDGSGLQLQRVLQEHAGLETQQGWLSFDEAYAIYSQGIGLGSGQEYYHWVAFRGTTGANLWIANSAEGYRGIYDQLSRYDYDRLGPWSCLWIV